MSSCNFLNSCSHNSSVAKIASRSHVRSFGISFRLLSSLVVLLILTPPNFIIDSRHSPSQTALGFLKSVIVRSLLHLVGGIFILNNLNGKCFFKLSSKLVLKPLDFLFSPHYFRLK